MQIRFKKELRVDFDIYYSDGPYSCLSEFMKREREQLITYVQKLVKLPDGVDVNINTEYGEDEVGRKYVIIYPTITIHESSAELPYAF